MGHHTDRLRLTLQLFNERGPAMSDDPGVRELTGEWVDPEIECVSAGSIQGGVYHGIEGMARMVREFAGAWEELTTEVEDVVESEDSLVATIRYRGRGASSGAPIDEVYVGAVRLRDGVAIRWAIDRDRETALRAAGFEP